MVWFLKMLISLTINFNYVRPILKSNEFPHNLFNQLFNLQPSIISDVLLVDPIYKVFYLHHINFLFFSLPMSG